MDYEQITRQMKTSDLIACLIGGPVLRETADPDGSLWNAIGSSDQVTREMAREDFAARVNGLLAAVIAEIDRRIPIPVTP